MAISAHFFDKFLQHALVDTTFVWTSDTVKVGLLTSAWTPNQATNDVWSDISANEVVGTGYTAGGATLANKTQGLTTHVLKLDGDDTSWATSTITARYAALYDTTQGNKLIGYVDFGADVSSLAATFTIVWNAAGIFTITMS